MFVSWLEDLSKVPKSPRMKAKKENIGQFRCVLIQNDCLFIWKPLKILLAHARKLMMAWSHGTDDNWSEFDEYSN